MSMITKEQYLEKPCGASSLPYWKAVSISVPENMKILHGDDFSTQMLEKYTDESYFRLKHDLQDVKPAAILEGFSLCTATLAAFVDNINRCYGGGCMTVDELRNYTARNVYCPYLWLALRDDRTGEIVASGIAELDREIGEGVLEWIQVLEGYRSRGLGSYIVRELLWRMKDKAKFVTVSGQCNNPTNPEALYRKCGFTGDDVWHVMKKR